MRPVLIDEGLHGRLEDWAWWVRDRAAAGYRCRSAEGRYRPERVDDERRQPRRLVDAQDALLMERTVSQPEFPCLARALLLGWYILRASRPQICRRCGVPLAQWEERMGWAGRMLKNRLDILTRASYATANNSTPADPVSIPCLVAGTAVDERKAARQA